MCTTISSIQDADNNEIMLRKKEIDTIAICMQKQYSNPINFVIQSYNCKSDETFEINPLAFEINIFLRCL